MKKMLVTIIGFIFFYAIAHADCWDNGTNYPTGTKKNGRECKSNGNWE